MSEEPRWSRPCMGRTQPKSVAAAAQQGQRVGEVSPCPGDCGHMKLIEAVRQIDSLDVKETLFARQPWAPESEAALAVEGTAEEERLRGQGMSYFLEVAVAKDFVIGLWDTRRKAPRADLVCRRLIEYAAN